MPKDLDLASLITLSKTEQTAALAEVNALLEQKSAKERIEWALQNLEGEFVLSSSFGIQAAVCLHMVTSAKADTPIILTDTGYLFPETYRFIDELTEKLKLNLKIYSAQQSAAWQEARYGKLWEQGVDGLTQYNALNKVEPMKRALRDLNAKTWFSGLRRSQSSSREDLPVLSIQNNCFKFLPIIDWSNKDVHYYLQDNGLNYHPLWDQGYVSVGDVQTSRPLEVGMSEEETRFFGLKRECGLHEDPVEEQGSGI
nr:phosphoadenosine phosphosulfate reductase [uncultured bacterium]